MSKVSQKQFRDGLDHLETDVSRDICNLTVAAARWHRFNGAKINALCDHLGVALVYHPEKTTIAAARFEVKQKEKGK